MNHSFEADVSSSFNSLVMNVVHIRTLIQIYFLIKVSSPKQIIQERYYKFHYLFRYIL